MAEENTLNNEEYDAVVLGTGLVESIVASDIAAAEKKVLHIDRNPFYGGDYASFSLIGFIEWATRFRDPNQVPVVDIAIGDVEIQLGARKSGEVSASNLLPETVQCGCQVGEILAMLSEHLSSEQLEQLSNSDVLQGLAGESRRYALELAPKLTFCRGPLIDVLIAAGMAEYMEFKGVDANLLVTDAGVERVPDSKEEVFASTALKLIEKRKLMRLLTTISDPEQVSKLASEHGSEDFGDLLKKQFKLDGSLLNAVLHAVARATRPISVSEGCARVEKYLKSIGRYGRMAFLSSMYGSGAEVAQAFCRSCAVAGGTYILSESIKQIERTESGYVVELSHGRVTAKSLIMHPSYLSDATESETEVPVARRFTVLDSPALGEDTTSMLSFVEGNHVISMLYLTSATMVVPKGKSLVYAWTEGRYSQSKELLDRAIDSAVGDKAHRMLSVGFECRALAPRDGYTCTPGMADESVDLDSAVQAAQQILDVFFGSGANE